MRRLGAHGLRRQEKLGAVVHGDRRDVYGRYGLLHVSLRDSHGALRSRRWRVPHDRRAMRIRTGLLLVLVRRLQVLRYAMYERCGVV